MAIATQDNATHRTVVLLRLSEKKRLQKLAHEQKVSASEVIRRLIHETSPSATEEQAMHLLFKQMNEALDHALEAIRDARVEVAENNRKIAEMRKKRI